MGVYALDIRHIRPVVAAVAAHGATDLDSWRWPPWYTLFYFAPLPPAAVTTLFIASSLVHFAEDVGIDGSLALHSLAGFLWVAASAQRGIEFMMAYLACVHMPAHYARCWRRRRWSALVVAAGATAMAMLVCRGADTVSLTHSAQRVVIAHVCTEWSVGHSK